MKSSDKHLEMMSRWLKGSQIPLRVGFSSSGLRIDVDSQPPSGDQQAALRMADGEVVLQVEVAAIEQVLRQVSNAMLQEHGASVEGLVLTLHSAHPRSLRFSAAIDVRKGFFAASLELVGAVEVNKQLHARVHDLDVRGKGVMGKMVASLVRPKLEAFDDQPVQLESFAPQNLALADVQFHVTEQLQLTLSFGESHVVLGSAANPLPDVEWLGPSAAKLSSHQSLRDKRLDIYVIDTGWNPRAQSLLDEHLALFAAFLAQQNVYRLTPEQSLDILRRSPELAGCDPILMVLDSDARLERPHLGYGFRFCLGAVTPEERYGEELRRVFQMMTETQRRGTKSAAANGERMRVLMDVVESQGGTPGGPRATGKR
ncbi:MAG: hypothetical protein U0939_06065 [Pirellulales bacterium]